MVVLLAQEVGLARLTVAKIVTVAFVALLMVVIATRRRYLALGLFVFAVMAGVVSGVSSIATL